MNKIEQQAMETAIKNNEVLRSRLAKYEDADGKALGVVVPASSAMIRAGVKAMTQGDECAMDCLPESLLDQYEREVSYIYEAMLSAAPKAADHIPDATKMVDSWIKCVDEMPKIGKPALANYRNSHGMSRTILAYYVDAWTELAEDIADPDSECVEYSKQDDAYYLLAGWYELIDNWDEYASAAVTEGVITRWHPLQAAGEESSVEVVAWLSETFANGRNCQRAALSKTSLQGLRSGTEDKDARIISDEPLITLASHQAEAERLNRLVKHWQGLATANRAVAERQQGEVVRLRGEVERLTKDAGAEMFLTLTGEITTLRTQLEQANALLREIRPTMPRDVLQLWCADRDAHLARQARP